MPCVMVFHIRTWLICLYYIILSLKTLLYYDQTIYFFFDCLYLLPFPSSAPRHIFNHSVPVQMFFQSGFGFLPSWAFLWQCEPSLKWPGHLHDNPIERLVVCSKYSQACQRDCGFGLFFFFSAFSGRVAAVAREHRTSPECWGELLRAQLGAAQLCTSEQGTSGQGHLSKCY